MKLTDKRKKVIDIIQWILILGLVALTAFAYFHKADLDQYNKNYQDEQVYAKIYESQEIETLKKRNRELYDSIKKIGNAETAVEIRYIYKYSTDTVTIEKFVQSSDSIYSYVADNDTIRTEINIKAKELDWATAEMAIHDKFIIVNAEDQGQNYLEITHSPNMLIESVDAWHRNETKKWYDNVKFGPQIGVGYGMVNNQIDIYVGVGMTVTF